MDAFLFTVKDWSKWKAEQQSWWLCWCEGVVLQASWAFQPQGCFTSWTNANSSMAREAGDFRTCCLISCFSNFHMASVVPTSGLCQAGQLHCLWHSGHPAVSVTQPRTISIVSTLWEKYPQGKHRPNRRLLWGFPESELVKRNTWQCELRLLAVLESSGVEVQWLRT